MSTLNFSSHSNEVVLDGFIFYLEVWAWVWIVVCARYSQRRRTIIFRCGWFHRGSLKTCVSDSLRATETESVGLRSQRRLIFGAAEESMSLMSLCHLEYTSDLSHSLFWTELAILSFHNHILCAVHARKSLVRSGSSPNQTSRWRIFQPFLQWDNKHGHHRVRLICLHMKLQFKTCLTRKRTQPSHQTLGSYAKPSEAFLLT